MRERLKLFYPFVDDALLDEVIANAEGFFCSYTNLDEVPDCADAALFRMCSEDLNRVGSEGYTAESLQGCSVSYLEDYSDAVYRMLNGMKRIRYVM